MDKPLTERVTGFSLQAFPASGTESVGGKWHNGTFMKTEVNIWKLEGVLARASAQALRAAGDAWCGGMATC